MSNFTAKKIWMDKKFIPWENAKIHVLSHVIHYGTGVFEGIRAYKNKSGTFIFRLEDHYKRLIDSGKIYKLVSSYSLDELITATLKLLKENDLEEAYIRPLVFRGFNSLGIDPRKCPIQTMIATWNWGRYLGEDALKKGIHAGFSSWQRIAPNTLPSLAKACGNYLNAQLIKIEALERGYAEGIALDKEGYLSEGSGENIFVVKDNVLYTPSSSNSILHGITRDSVIKIAKELNIEVIEKKIPREKVYTADEIFFTGTAAEITPIVKIDSIPINHEKVGEMTKSIQEYFFGIIQGEKEDKYNWLYPVQ